MRKESRLRKFYKEENKCYINLWRIIKKKRYVCSYYFYAQDTTKLRYCHRRVFHLNNCLALAIEMFDDVFMDTSKKTTWNSTYLSFLMFIAKCVYIFGWGNTQRKNHKTLFLVTSLGFLIMY